MTRRWIVLFVVIILVCLCIGAGAEVTYTYLNENAITLTMPYGLSYSTQYNDQTGILRVLVNVEDTDWELVASTGYIEANESFDFGVRLENPEGSLSDIQCISAHDGSESDLAYLVENNGGWPGNGNYSSQWWLGGYNADSSLFIPTAYGNEPYTNVFWNDSQPGTVYRLDIYIEYSNNNPFNITPAYLPEGNISANDKDLADITSKVEDGKVTYVRVAQQATAPNLITAFTIPEQSGHNDWTVYQIAGGTEFAMTSQGTMNGLPRYVLQWPSTSENISTVMQGSFTVVLKSANNVVQAAYNLNITLKQGPLTLWPENPPNGNAIISPVPSNRLSYEVIGRIPGVDLAYSNGLLHMIVDNEELLTVTDVNMEGVTAWANVTPYPGAGYLAVYFTGAQNLYDSRNYNVFYQEPSQDQRYECGDGFVWESPYFYSLQYDSGRKILYKSANYDNNNFGGMLPILFWYENLEDTSPLHVEYLAVIEDSVTLRYASTIVDNENNIPTGDRNKPILVDSQGQYLGNTLKVTAFPTNDDLMYYELIVVDDAGRNVPLQGVFHLYIPYPAGYDQNNSQDLTFTISHYSSDGSEVTESFSGDQIQRTAFGLCVTVTSLSPFTLGWQDTTMLDFPQTGDQMHVELYLIMAALCIIGLGFTLYLIKKAKYRV